MSRRTFLDALGTSLAFEKPPQRIISLIPSVTELLFALGLDERIVGVTKFCTHPPEGVAKKEKIGGEKNPDLQKILALNPDLVIANVEENRREDVEALKMAGVPVFVTYPRTVEGGIALIRQLGALTSTWQAAEGIARPIEEIYQETLALTKGKRPTRVFCPIWRRPYMTINQDTYVHDMIRVCGGENIFEDHPERYPQVTLEEVEELRPEIILLPDEPYP
ncbi:MAG: cobalamin-binding protein, partial [candidate division NC10 bacterium]|nr:cobalamin-binding protein [candidate division NC10 bacterium]